MLCSLYRGLGYGLMLSVPLGIVGCRRLSSLGWTPVFLSEIQARTVQIVTDRIIPPSTIPGALEVGAHRFADLMLARGTSAKQQGQFLEGLSAFESAVQEQTGKSVTECLPEQIDDILTLAASSDGPARFFFQKMKELTFFGYFTSQQVGLHVLRYDPVPGAYQGCIPLEPSHTIWAI